MTILRVKELRASSTSRHRGTGDRHHALLEGFAQDLDDMALELGQLIQKENAMMRQGHLPRQGLLASADQAHLGDRVARNGRVVTKAVRPPVRPATRWMQVGSRASARRIAGRMV